MHKDSVSKQFSDPLLVSAYDALNALGDDSEFFCSLVKNLSAQTIIDLGCGTGLLTCQLAELGYTMIGIDPAGMMLDLARKKQYAEKVKWIIGNHKKFDGLLVDMVLMTSHVAQFFIDDNEWKLMLAASYDALNVGGYIVFDSRRLIFPPFQNWPTRDTPRRVEDPALGSIDWYYKLLEIKGNRVRYELHFHFINTDNKITSTDELIFRSQDELTESLEDAGFKIEIIYGDWDSSLVTPISHEMIFVAKKVSKNPC